MFREFTVNCKQTKQQASNAKASSFTDTVNASSNNLENS